MALRDIRGKNMEQTTQKRILAENILFGCIGALGAAMIAASFLPTARFSGLLLEILEVKKMTARLFGFVQLILPYHLYRRKKTAWYFTVVIIAFSAARHLLPPVHRMFLCAAALECVFLVLLFWFRADFCCPSAPDTLRRSALVSGLAVAGILVNTGLSYHFVRLDMPGMPRGTAIFDSVRDAWSILFGVNEGSAPGTPLGRFETVMFWFSWVCVLLALLLALRPWIARFLWSEEAVRRARALVLRYGQNPASYLTLEKDKLLYFGRTVEGVLPYGIVGSTVVVNGDPVCAPENFSAFLAEFRTFCTKSDHKLFFLSITGRYLEEYKAQGFGIAKCGEEARFALADYDIAGKKGAKMRMNINHATKAGVTVAEYRPLEKREPEVEAAMAHITAEWLADKKSGLLSFTMGTVGLEAPMDRRYFYARDAAGRICGFNVYCPYDDKKGYMADITRRTHDAPGGVTEKIMYEAFAVFRREGVESVSMGIAPLANLTEPEQRPNSIEKLLNFVYEHLNACYGFKDLYRAKENYSPTEWLPGYYAWLPRIPDPAMFYAVVRVQNPQGMGEYVQILARAFREKQKAKRAAPKNT